MYVPPAFRDQSLESLHATMRSAQIANLVTVGAVGIVSTPLPLLLDPSEGEQGVLYGHLARANPQWKMAPTAEALAIFMGADAYISPSWYERKKVDGKVVPTYNYISVHAYGPVEFFEDAERLLAVVTRLTNQYESSRSDPWAVTDAPSDFIKAQLRGIVGLRIPIVRLEGKRKLSQNRPAVDQVRVAQELTSSERSLDRAVAVAMQKP